MANIKGTKSHILTLPEKEKMVREHFERGISHAELSRKYRISYSAVRKNCENYKLYGIEGLKSKTGKSNVKNFQKFENPNSREKAMLKAEIVKLREENERLAKIIESPKDN
ncbi:helix-turn-helix domain-containing protein [[Acholeplasma] multilocale]|uniref:helix-turn-helix domain-containing protein n=1 Tax=[Acholeplasma] multilocale TaxID=264638 RepID=UPI00054E27C8|nr:helix-turn-helix domain-containing protein [[Acholeplasma] multilocale]